jgi:hypothetical protein
MFIELTQLYSSVLVTLYVLEIQGFHWAICSLLTVVSYHLLFNFSILSTLNQIRITQSV